MDFITLFIYFITSILFTEGLSYLITNSQLFSGWRIVVANIGKRLNLIDAQGINYFDYMVNCHLCTSHQIALFVSIYQPYLLIFPTNTVLLNIIITTVLVGRLSYIIFSIYEVLNVWLSNAANNQ